MKKTVSFLAISLIALFLSQPFPVTAKEIKQVVIIRYPIKPLAFQGVVEGFKKAMASQGLREGKEVVYIDVLTETADERSVPEVLAAVKRYRHTADMFLTCGWVSLYARRALEGSGIPQVFAPVLDIVALELVPSLNRPSGMDITGVYLMYPPGKVLRLARALIPGLRRMAYVYDSRIPADMAYKKAFESLDGEGLVRTEMVYLDMAKGMDEVIRAVKGQGIDVLCYLVGGMRYVKELNALGIPIVTAYAFDVDELSLKKKLMEEKATLAGYFNPFTDCGFQAGLMAARILKGARAGEIAPVAARQTAFVNLKASRMFAIPVDMSVLDTVDLIIR